MGTTSVVAGGVQESIALHTWRKVGKITEHAAGI